MGERVNTLLVRCCACCALVRSPCDSVTGSGVGGMDSSAIGSIVILGHSRFKIRPVAGTRTNQPPWHHRINASSSDQSPMTRTRRRITGSMGAGSTDQRGRWGRINGPMGAGVRLVAVAWIDGAGTPTPRRRRARCRKRNPHQKFHSNLKPQTHCTNYTPTHPATPVLHSNTWSSTRPSLRHPHRRSLTGSIPHRPVHPRSICRSVAP